MVVVEHYRVFPRPPDGAGNARGIRPSILNINKNKNIQRDLLRLEIGPLLDRIIFIFMSWGVLSSVGRVFLKAFSSRAIPLPGPFVLVVGALFWYASDEVPVLPHMASCFFFR